MNIPPHQQFSTDDENLRSNRRFKTELPVLVNTVLDDQQGWIAEISYTGLKLLGIHAPQRSRVFIHYKGHMAEGTVRWSRRDLGIGVVLDVPLKTGPLAMVWRRFHENVEAFGKHAKAPKPMFGRRSGG